MLTLLKPFGHIFGSMKAARIRVAMWWLKMTDQEQRDVVIRGFTTAGAAFAACILLPTFGVSFEAQREDAAFRTGAKMLAEADSASQAVRSAEIASPLLDHPWVRSVEYSMERNPRAALSRYAMRDRDGAAVSSVMEVHSNQFDRAEVLSAEFDCLTQAVYYEAGYESTEGKLAVAEVIMNRVSDHRYPNSVCEVVYQGATRTTGCQFTFTCDGALRRRPNKDKWDKARTVAAHVLMGLNERRTGSATHYHATYVDPIWNVGLVRTNKIGAHIFYRFPRGAEWAVARNAVARKKEARARVASLTIEEADTVVTPQTSSVTAPAP